MSDERVIQVAIGIVWRVPGECAAPDQPEVLISRRVNDGVLGGYWEFPGGKLDSGESAEACVVRELREELGIEVRATRALEAISHRYDHGRVELRPFFCAHVRGEPEALQVAAWRWVEVAALGDYQFPPANAGLLEQVRRWASDKSGPKA
ncbi:MAG: 8-oxo-dGTP diphosphatase MutT [Planctomycetota bacterium]